MINRPTGLLALATLGLILSVPVHAAPDFMDAAVVVAKRDFGDDPRQSERNNRHDERRSQRRDAGRETPPGYGYGYERRQQERSERDVRHEEDSRSRGRR